MWYTLVLSVLIIAVAIFILSVKVIFVKNGRFPDGHIGRDKNMKNRGITCSISTDAGDRNKKGLNDRLNLNKQ
ncbi:MAG: hypothetical protein RR293_05925 [Bacteroidales bacterium]